LIESVDRAGGLVRKPLSRASVADVGVLSEGMGLASTMLVIKNLLELLVPDSLDTRTMALLRYETAMGWMA
jgi:hypothetical protein